MNDKELILNDKNWLEYLPVFEKDVNFIDYAALINLLYGLTHDEDKIITSYGIWDIAQSCNLILEPWECEFYIAPGATDMFSLDGTELILKRDGQIFIKQYLLDWGFLPIEGEEDRVWLPFSLSQEQLDSFELSETPLSLSQIIGSLNRLMDKRVYRKVNMNSIANFLVNEGLLEVVKLDGGRFIRRATEKGNKEGITYVERKDSEGNSYFINVYDKFAQFYILENMEKISQFNSGELKSSDDGIQEENITESGRTYECKDCMDYRNGNCFGAQNICEDFRFSPTFSAEETKNWPTEGEASYLRRTGKRRD